MHRLTEKDEQGNWALKGVKWASLHVGQTITKEMGEDLWRVMEVNGLRRQRTKPRRGARHGGAAARYKEVRKHPDAAEDGRPHYAALYRV